MGQLWDNKLKERIYNIDKLFKFGEVSAEQGFLLRVVAIIEYNQIGYEEIYSEVVIKQKTLKDFMESK